VCWCRLWVSPRPADGHLQRGEFRSRDSCSRHGADRCDDD
jgi:hypothetical protein